MVSTSKPRKTRSRQNPAISLAADRTQAASSSKKVKRQVPKPDIQRPLDLGVRTTSSVRSADARQRMAEEADARRVTFFANYATRICLDHTLEEIKSPVSDKRAAQWEEVISRQLPDDSPAIAYSTVYEDSTGHPIFAYFGQRIRDRPSQTLTLEQQYIGRTQQDLDAIDNSRLIHDGLLPEICHEYHKAIQQLCSAAPPKPQTDSRHGKHDPMFQFSLAEPASSDDEDYGTGARYSAPADTSEACGAHHLVHAWAPRGHDPRKGLFLCRNLFQTSSLFQSLPAFYTLTQRVALVIGHMFRVVWPDVYQVYQQAFEAGRWFEQDPGPFLGRVIVYKLQVHTHADKHDAGPSACFPVGSWQSGGHLLVPQLGAKFQYSCGDVAIFYAGKLYHKVSEWTPLPKKADDSVTPGRVGNVFFNPECSLTALDKKPPGWGVKTGYGLMTPLLPTT